GLFPFIFVPSPWQSIDLPGVCFIHPTSYRHFGITSLADDSSPLILSPGAPPLLLGGIPWPHSGKTSRCDARDVPRVGAMGLRRNLDGRTQINVRQPLQQHSRPALGNPRRAVDDQILL